MKNNKQTQSIILRGKQTFLMIKTSRGSTLEKGSTTDLSFLSIFDFNVSSEVVLICVVDTKRPESIAEKKNQLLSCPTSFNHILFIYDILMKISHRK